MSVLAALALAMLGAGCGGPAKTPQKPAENLRLSRPCDLAQAASLDWIVEASPKRIAQIDDLIPAIAMLVPEARWSAFASANGGVDVRQVDELCVANYARHEGATTLAIAKVGIDPNRVERTFTERSTRILNRSVVVERPRVVEIDADVTGQRESLGVFGRELVARERGPGGSHGPLHAAIAFARGRLRRSPSAFENPELARALHVLGDAPLRALFRGPFTDDAAGALVKASSTIGVALSFQGAPAKIGVRLVFLGSWGKDPNAAARHLTATAHAMQESALGRLLGLDRPVTAPTATATEDALVLETTLDGMALARGLRDATSAEIADVFTK